MNCGGPDCGNFLSGRDMSKITTPGICRPDYCNFRLDSDAPSDRRAALQKIIQLEEVFVLTLRQADNRDVGSLELLGTETYRSHFTSIWSPARLEAYIASEYSAPALAESLARPDLSIWLIAALDAEPIGFAKLNWNRPLPLEDGRTGTELQKIYLRAERTGQGHGGAMLQAVVDRLQARGDTLLWLDVLKSNAGARAFYERHGFKVLGELPFATDVREIGFWVMTRDL